MQRWNWAVGFLLATCFCISAVSAAEGTADSQDLGDVLVTPKRIPGLSMQESHFPGNATVISKSQIAASGAKMVTDLLARQEGITITDFRGFGLGADSGLSIRGFGNGSRNNALVLVDGVRQNRITGDEVHWQAIPIEQIERIEIIRGGGGMIYGEGALSGVVNIITKKGGTQPVQWEGSAEGGSYDHFRESTLLRGAVDRFSYGAGVVRDQGSSFRSGTDYRATSVNLFGGIAVTPETQLELRARYHQDTSGFDGGLTKTVVEQDRKNRGSFFGFLEDHSHTVSAQLTQRIGDAWNVGGELSDNHRDGDSSSMFGRFGTITSTHAAGLRASHEASGSIWKTGTVFGIDLAGDKAVTGDRSGSKSESNRWGYGLFVEETLDLFHRLALTLGFRHDKSRYEEDLNFPVFAGTLHFSGNGPRAGLNYSVNDRLNLFASMSRVFKAPNIDDLDAVLPPFKDNLDVKPQKADHYEAGVRWQAVRWAKLKLAGFAAHTKDEILFNPFTFANSNFTTQRAGLELNVSGELSPRGIGYYATYTFTRARFHKGAFTGYEIPLTPEHQATGGLHVPFTSRFSADLDVRWVGQQFRVNDFNNQFPADIYGVVDLTVAYQFPKTPKPKVYLTVLNLLDEEYETFPSSNGAAISTGENPAPPRAFVAGVSWNF